MISSPGFGSSDELSNSSLHDNNDSKASGMDDFQSFWSSKIVRFSSYLDQELSQFAEDEDNSSVLDIERGEYLAPNQTFLTSMEIDEFFRDDNYLDTNNRSYVLVHGGYEYDALGESSIFKSITARIKLPKTQGKLQLYIGREMEKNIDLSHSKHDSNNEGVGLKYFMPTFLDYFYTSASIGFSKINNPYAEARIEYPIVQGNWLVKPVQQFKFSRENEFEEWTNLYFDKKLSESEMFRLLVQRSTKSSVEGMDYLTQLSYMNTQKSETGFNHYIAMNGRTKDLEGKEYANGTTPQEGVYEYSVGTIWRQKLLRDYLFYQIQPIVSFHEQYNFKPDYILQLSIDLYFRNNR